MMSAVIMALAMASAGERRMWRSQFRIGVGISISLIPRREGMLVRTKEG